MPGIQVFMVGNGELLPPVQSYPLANNLAGAQSTSNPGAMSIGDFVVLTKATALTSNAVPVVRSLLQQDITDLYQQGGLNIGILGISGDNLATNAFGIINSQPQFINTVPPVIFSMPSKSAVWGTDPVSGRNLTGVQLSTPQVQFQGFLDPAANVTNMFTLPGTQAGLTITTNSYGQNVYLINPLATTKILTIQSVDTSDPSYGTTGALVRFVINPAYNQYNNVNGFYTSY
jgi:hypothetical protein